MNEDQEAIQFIMSAGRFVTAPAKDILLTACRAVEHGAFDVIKSAGRAAKEGFIKGSDVLFSMVDGMGSTGCVSYWFLTKKLQGRQMTWYDVPEELKRDDLKALANECRKRGMAFSVYKNVEGDCSIVFAASDAETMEHAMRDVFKSTLTAEERRAAKKDSTIPEGVEVNPQTYRFNNEIWNPVEVPEGIKQDQKGTVIAFEASLEDSEGNIISRLAMSDGSYIVTVNEPGKDPAIFAQDKVSALQGGSLEAAMQQSTAIAKGLTDAQKRRKNQALSGPEPDKVISGPKLAQKVGNPIAERNRLHKSMRQARKNRMRKADIKPRF